MSKTIKNSQILKASLLGTKSFKNGVKCAPCYDKELLNMLTGRNVGETPTGEASSVDIMTAWTNAWHAANLAKTNINF